MFIGGEAPEALPLDSAREFLPLPFRAIELVTTAYFFRVLIGGDDLIMKSIFVLNIYSPPKYDIPASGQNFLCSKMPGPAEAFLPSRGEWRITRRSTPSDTFP